MVNRSDGRGAIRAVGAFGEWRDSGRRASAPGSAQARVWNYWLGGTDNFPVDRAAGDQYRATFPGIEQVARVCREFLVRGVSYLAGEAGIRQFLDVGGGLPTADNTHEVAQRVAPDARVVYVDHDPMVVAHARTLLASGPQGAIDYVLADLEDPDRVLAEAGRTLDLTRPVALILSGVMGHVGDTAVARDLIRRLLGPLPPGSYLLLCDGATVAADAPADKASEEYADTGAVPYRNRTAAEIGSFFDGLELVDPGWVSGPHLRLVTDAEPQEPDQIAGVGRK